MNGKFARHILIVIAALAMVSCMKETIVERDAISFAPVASKPTKAIIEGTDYPVGETFAVSAFYNGSAPYFSNLTATKASTDWETTAPEYWPLDGSLTFYAYSPGTSTGATTSAATGVAFSNYTVDHETDLCIASYTESNCAQRASSTVPLQFSHALSQIVVKIRQTQNYNAEINNKSNIVAITVNELSLKDMYVNAAFAQLPTPTWSITQESETGDYEFSLGNSGYALTAGAAAQQVGRLLTIPQSLEGIYLHTVYTVRQTVTDNTTDETEVFSVTTPVDIPLSQYLSSWACGKKYVYTLSFGLEPIEIQASTVEWVADGGEIIVEEE